MNQHGMDDMGSRRCAGRAVVGWLLLLSSACAGPPEPLPPYADARMLREDATLRAVAFADDRLGIACGDRGTILRTDNGGESWVPRAIDVDCRLDDVVWLTRSQVIIVGGGYDRITRISRGIVLRSDDGGVTWQQTKDQDLPRLKQIRRRDDRSLGGSMTGQIDSLRCVPRHNCHYQTLDAVSDFSQTGMRRWLS